MRRFLFLSLLNLLLTGCFAQVSNCFNIDVRSHIYINGEQDGVTSHFVFDTGAYNLYSDSTFLTDSGLKYDRIGRAKLPGAGNEVKTVKIIMNPVSYKFAGNNYYVKSPIPIFNLKAILGDFADGIIGCQYFLDKVVYIDYILQKMAIVKTVDSLELEGFTKVKIEREGTHIVVPATITLNNGMIFKKKYIVDLGSGGSVSINSECAKEQQLKQNAGEQIAYKMLNGGVGGNSSGYQFMAKSVNIAGYNIENPYITYSADSSGALSGKQRPTAGLIGNKIMSRFDVVIDYPNNVLYLRANKNLNKNFEINHWGFDYTDRSHTLKSWCVNSIDSNGKAEKAGLKLGDKIVEVNDKSVVEYDYWAQKEILKGKTLKLKTADGCIFTIAL